MGVKSTVYMTRESVIDRIMELKTRVKRKEWGEKLDRKTDTELEDLMERLNDKANDGEGFENYTIR